MNQCSNFALHYPFSLLLCVVVKPEPTTSPVYLQALMPMPEDSLDTTSEREESEVSPSTEENQRDGTNTKDPEGMDVQSSVVETPESSMDVSTDSFENPFLKVPKQARSRP